MDLPCQQLRDLLLSLLLERDEITKLPDLMCYISLFSVKVI